MFKTLNKYLFLFKSMGLPYWSYRLWYEIKKRTGILRLQFPVNPTNIPEFKKQDWLGNKTHFFFSSKKDIRITPQPTASLQQEAEDVMAGKIKFFNGEIFNLTTSYNWLTDPLTGKQYDSNTHWSRYNDFSGDADIKYVWEKSRFCYLYTILRYDHHFNRDCSEFVISEIISWIDHAPVNCGPQYISSQEIALRILNWTYFLHYYRDSAALTEDRISKIFRSIYLQAVHIRKHLNFSGYLVRNNHLLTEATALYITGLLFPFFPQAIKWKKKGLKIFEREIAFQISEDGTYLQHSMNYNRVVVQLMTWVLHVAKLNNEAIADVVNERAQQTLKFLYNCTNSQTGAVPNYGANDGSLFFPLSGTSISDYRPQLQALSVVSNAGILFEGQFEELGWYGIEAAETKSASVTNPQMVLSFPDNGYYLFRDEETFTFTRCGNHEHRPSQADNLHVDLWYREHNIMRDAGTFRYNCEKKLIDFYFGTASHNTVMLGDESQMEKGPRFIWYYWSKCNHAHVEDPGDKIIFNGSISAFRQTGKWITHERQVIKYKNEVKWEITDSISENNSLPVVQIWNPSDYFYAHFRIEAFDMNGQPLEPVYSGGYYSETYGIRSETKRILFKTNGNLIKTLISLNP